ncbi:MAG: calcium-binding protein [Piscinibacter sp.]
MATYNGSSGNDNFGSSTGDDIYQYGNVTYNGSTISAARGLDRIVGSAGFDTLVFANVSITHVYGVRSGADFTLFLQPTTSWDHANPNTTLGGVTLVGMLAGGATVERINFEGFRALTSVTGDVLSLTVYNQADALVRTHLLGGAGNDSLRGSSANDLLQGFAGNDTLRGMAGDDELEGGPGLDTADFSDANGSIEVRLGDGLALPWDSTGHGATNMGGADSLSGVERVIAGRYADVLQGSEASDTLNGGAGHDSLSGLAGNDSLAGGAGSDFFSGGIGNGLGNDTLDGGTITGVFGDCDLNIADYRGTTNSIVLNLVSGSATDGTGGIDKLVNINGLWAGAGNDTLTGTTLARLELFGGGMGNDTIIGGAIADTLNFTDANRAVFDSVTAPVTVDLAAGTASGQGNDLLVNINQVRGGGGNDRLLGSNSTVLIERLEGGAGNDTIDGRGGLDFAAYEYAIVGVSANLAAGTAVLDNGTDRDTLSHIEGLCGSHFADTLIGGNTANAALEFFTGNGGNDTIDGGAGYDRVDYVNAMQSVVVTLGGTANGTASDGTPILDGRIVVAGTPEATTGIDVLRRIEAVRGSQFDDTLNGSGIATEETFEGRAGDDLIDGNAGLDRVTYIGSTSAATVTLGLAGAAGSASDGWGQHDTLRDIENVQGTRDFADRITGNELANLLDGLGGNDSLNGGSGNDTLLGGNGNDTLNGSTGADSLVGGNGSDTYMVSSSLDRVIESGSSASSADHVISSFSWSLSATGNAAVERLTLIGSAASGTGNALANIIVGNAVANTLNGGSGNDTLTGGAGTDLFRFTTAPNAASNADRITDFSAADDTFQLDDVAFAGIGSSGALAAGAFRVGTAAADTTDRIVYDQASGRLYFDADGSGAGTAVLFATVTANVVLSAADFIIA